MARTGNKTAQGMEGADEMKKLPKEFTWDDAVKLINRYEDDKCAPLNRVICHEAFATHKAITKKMAQVEELKEWVSNSYFVFHVQESFKDKIDEIFRS